jgi:hypothetical protein
MLVESAKKLIAIYEQKPKKPSKNFGIINMENIYYFIDESGSNKEKYFAGRS